MPLCIYVRGFSWEVCWKPCIGCVRVNDEEDIMANASLELFAFAQGLEMPSLVLGASL